MKTDKSKLKTQKQQLDIPVVSGSIKKCKLKSTNIKRVEACRNHKGLCIVCKYYR